MPVFIKEANYYRIHDFALRGNQSYFQGLKLRALYKLIQTKGETITAPKELKDKGVKALDYSNGQGTFVAIDLTTYKSGELYPCKMKVIAVQEL